MWDFDKKKMCGVKPHIGIGAMKKMWNLICGKFTAGRNYNLTLNIRIIQMSQEMPNLRRFLALVFCCDNQMTIILKMLRE